MGWLNDLYQTYEANLAHVGKSRGFARQAIHAASDVSH